MSREKIIAVIPARKGSKRLPRKNVLEFLGKPIISYTIEAAKQANIFEKIVVSTDDSDVAEIAKALEVEVSIRRPDLATDTATVAQVCLDLLESEEEAGRTYESLCCLYATAPLRNGDDIRATVALLDSQCDFAMAITRYTHYPYQALRKNSDGFLAPMWPEYVLRRSEEIGDLFAGNGSTYAVKVSRFRQTGEFYGENLRGHPMPVSRSIDIDTREDFELATLLALGAMSLDKRLAKR